MKKRAFALVIAFIMMINSVQLISCVSAAEPNSNESGYELWLRYRMITDPERLSEIGEWTGGIVATEKVQVIDSAVAEIQRGIQGLTGKSIAVKTRVTDGSIILGTSANPYIKELFGDEAEKLGGEGYIIRSTVCDGKKVIAVAGGGASGVLYGTFKLLEMMRCGEKLDSIDYSDAPAIRWRVLDQWDNWNGSIERGYAGRSIYNWSELPGTVDSRYEDFARANASVGINTIVINNVNAQSDYIKSENLPKIKAVADVFRKYGIRLALTVRFDSPMLMPSGGGTPALSTSDPLVSGVINWWNEKLDEIYGYIPDFAGILVKADSEGQPGPSKYGRTHADGANMLAAALRRHGDGIVMWRAFVYGEVANSLSSDIVLQAYDFFKPLDGKFDDNVIVQSKNGPRDFLPREPVSPLFGGMTDTNLGMELQITQEYTGQSTHLCYLVPMWKSYLDFDTQSNATNAEKGVPTTVDRIVDGSLYNRDNTLMAGVANVGSDENWTRLELAQANWYGFGRLAWNPSESADDITDAWIRLTFGNDDETASVLGDILNRSWEVYESYTSPYGTGMTFKQDGHFDPAPESRNGKYIFVDKEGYGTNRNSTNTGYNRDATVQYFPAVRELYNNIDTCPEELLTWFHHVPYDYVMSNGKTMLQNLFDSFNDGPLKVRELQNKFRSLSGRIDTERFNRILSSFDAQYSEAVKWRTAMTAFLEKASGRTENNYSFTNLALGKTAVASQTRNNYRPSLVTDGITTGESRWATNQTDERHYIFVDLGSVQNINRVDLYWENFSAVYVIETAVTLTKTDGSAESDWTTVAVGYGNEWKTYSPALWGENHTTVLFADTAARYVRMRTLEKNSGLWNSVREFEVYGDKFSDTARYILAKDIRSAKELSSEGCTATGYMRFADAVSRAETILNREYASDAALLSAVQGLKTAYAELEYTNLARAKKARRSTVSGTNHAANAIDGNMSTYWDAVDPSGTQPSLSVDFREVKTFNKITIDWKSPTTDYVIEYRTSDNDSWKTLKTVNRSSSGFSGKNDVLKLEQNITAGQIRLRVTGRSGECSVYELGVYYEEAVTAKQVSSLISAIGTVTADSGDAIDAACRAFDLLDEKGRGEVTGAGELSAAITEYRLLTTPADYGSVENAVESAKHVDRSLYSESSLKRLDTAVSAVVYGLCEKEQDTVDTYVSDILFAVDNLVLKELEFDIVISDGAVVKNGNRYNITWNAEVIPGKNTSVEKINASGMKLTEYGIYLSTNEAALSDIRNIGGADVRKEVFGAGSDIDVNTLFGCRLKNVPKGRPRSAMFYIVYEYCGKSYTILSDISSAVGAEN